MRSRRPSLSRAVASRRALLGVCLVAILGALVIAPDRALHQRTVAAGTPTLLAQTNSTRAIALESPTFRVEPFSPTAVVRFSADDRTRVLIFASTLGLLPGEGASAVTAEAEALDSNGLRIRYPLLVESASQLPGSSGISSLIVRLNDSLGDAGDVLIGVTVHGQASNRVRIGVGHLGGGPPDDLGGPVPDLGPGASLHGKQLFPGDNAWNEDVSVSPVDANSDNLISSIGMTSLLHPDFGTVYNGAPNGIPYIVVAGTEPRVPINFTAYGDESDPGPYPVPPNAPIEGGPNASGDRHVIVIDRDNWKLYELGYSFPIGNGTSWNANCGAIFDLNSNAMRPAGWTSADAAGLPIFPGLVRYDEVFELGEIKHALRFTAQITRHAYVAPARHYASSNTSVNRPPMGMRVRLRASFDISTFTPRMQVILRALKKYGMILADNGSNWYLSGAPDPRWDDNELNALKTIRGSSFEVVQMGTMVTQ
ncbi:MAG: hypothetical protein ABI967_11055 [bacterium]